MSSVYRHLTQGEVHVITWPHHLAVKSDALDLGLHDIVLHDPDVADLLKFILDREPSPLYLCERALSAHGSKAFEEFDSALAEQLLDEAREIARATFVDYWESTRSNYESMQHAYDYVVDMLDKVEKSIYKAERSFRETVALCPCGWFPELDDKKLQRPSPALHRTHRFLIDFVKVKAPHPEARP